MYSRGKSPNRKWGGMRSIPQDHRTTETSWVLVSLTVSHLNPTIGHSLQMLHFAWCFAVSAAATRCRTGNHTMDCGSKCIQSINSFTLISGLLLFWRRDRKWRTALQWNRSKCHPCKRLQFSDSTNRFFKVRKLQKPKSEKCRCGVGKELLSHKWRGGDNSLMMRFYF